MPPKARAHQEKELSALSRLSLKIEQAKNLESALSTLASYPGKKDLFESSLRRLLFFLSFQKNPHYPKTQEDFPFSPDLAALDEMSEFINHLVKEETLTKIPLDQSARKEIGRILNIKALTEERQRAEKSARILGKKEVEIIPNRSLLGEFAGYYSDACYKQRQMS